MAKRGSNKAHNKSSTKRQTKDLNEAADSRSLSPSPPFFSVVFRSGAAGGDGGGWKAVLWGGRRPLCEGLAAGVAQNN